MVKYKLKLIDIIEEVKGTKTYYFEKPADLTWEEGSHTHIGHIGFDEGEQPNKNWVRHMSIMTLPIENKIGITTRVPGSSSEFKRKLSELKRGDEVILFKLGSRLQLKRSDRPVILISMGVGIAAFRPVILAYKDNKLGIPSLFNMNIDSTGEFIFKEELDQLVNDSYRNYWVASRPDFYEKLQQLANTENAIYYIVGSDPFIKDMIKYLRDKNVKEEDMILDKKEEKLQEYFIN